MSNFKNIEKLGLTIFDYKEPHHHFAVDAEELEALLQSAQVVYGNISVNEAVWFATPSTKGSDTHTALVIAITPIRKKTKAEAALELMERLHSMSGIFNVAWVKDDMKQILEMKDSE